MRFRDFMEKVKGRSSSDLHLGPPILNDAIRVPYGPFCFRTRLSRGKAYVVEASSDLKIWRRISEGIANEDQVDHVDSDASKFSYRFYRVLTEVVHSVNVVGYASVSLPPGFSLIANPLEATDNTISGLFKDWPDRTTLKKFDTGLFRLSQNEIKSKKWTNSNEKIMPAEGAIFYNPTADYKLHTFVGDVVQGHWSVPIPAGFSLRSSLVPQAGSLEDLGFPISDGDIIHVFDRDRQRYVLYPYDNREWRNGVPVLSVGESFWVAKTQPGTWNRNLVFSETRTSFI
jgi:hypothetical protein